MSSCNCSNLKKNIYTGGVFGVTRLAVSKKGKIDGAKNTGGKLKKEILIDTGIVTVGGYFYDKSVGAMIQPYAGANASSMMVKTIYELALLGIYDMAVKKKKINAMEIMRDAVALLVANYGIDMLDNAMPM